MGKMFISMLSMFSEFEVNLKKERQLEGIAKAKEKGIYTGRKPLDQNIIKEVWTLKAKGLGVTEISKELKIGCTTIYKYL